MPRQMKLSPYTPRWQESFHSTKAILQSIFKDIAIDIEHFGSTSIQGMLSKPIVDIMVVVTDIEKVDDLMGEMSKHAYVFRGENGIPGRRYFVKFDSEGINHVEHIHCYDKTHPHIINELMFRNFLRENKTAFDKYLATKMEAASRYEFNPIGYTEFKSFCISEILNEAKLHYLNVDDYKVLIDK